MKFRMKNTFLSIPAAFWAFTLAFLLNNCAFNVLAQLQSSINPDMGPLSVAISYIASTIVCLVLVPILFKATSKSPISYNF